MKVKGKDKGNGQVERSVVERLVSDLQRKIEKEGLSYRIAARRAGIPHPTLHHILNGETTTLSLKNFIPLREWADQPSTPNGAEFRRPYYAGVPAGTSPIEGQPDDEWDLNEKLINHPQKTFLVRVSGDSMIGENIFEGDVLIVERVESLEEVGAGDIVIGYVDGEFCVKKYHKSGTTIVLKSANPQRKDIALTPEVDCKIWGRVTYSIREFR